MNKQDIKEWLKGKPYMYSNANPEMAWLEDLILACFNELVPKWVSVEDRLPEEEEEILSCHNGMFSAKYGFERGRVTHWMPLPKTNKLEGGE